MAGRAKASISTLAAIFTFAVTNALTGGVWLGVLTGGIAAGIIGVLLPSGSVTDQRKEDQRDDSLGRQLEASQVRSSRSSSIGDQHASSVSSAVTLALELSDIKARVEKTPTMQLRQLKIDMNRLSEMGDHSLIPLLFTRFDERSVDSHEYDEYSKELYRFLSMFDTEVVLNHIRPFLLDIKIKGQLARLYLHSVGYIPEKECLEMLRIEDVRIRRNALRILSVNPANVASLDPKLLRQLSKELVSAIPSIPPEFVLDEKGRWLCVCGVKIHKTPKKSVCLLCERDWIGILPDDAQLGDVASRLDTIAATIESYSSDTEN